MPDGVDLGRVSNQQIHRVRPGWGFDKPPGISTSTPARSRPRPRAGVFAFPSLKAAARVGISGRAGARSGIHRARHRARRARSDFLGGHGEPEQETSNPAGQSGCRCVLHAERGYARDVLVQAHSATQQQSNSCECSVGTEHLRTRTPADRTALPRVGRAERSRTRSRSWRRPCAARTEPQRQAPS